MSHFLRLLRYVRRTVLRARLRSALTVLGSERAAAVAQQRDLAVYFIRRVGDNYHSSYTEGFAQYLADGPR